MTTSPSLPPGVVEYLTAFADDEHLIGARHTSWIGRGPFLEEDLAFCSIAQDEIGHAIALYELVSDDVDRFALLRDASEFRSCWLAEWPCVPWADALARHVLYDIAESHRWEAVASSSLAPLAAIAARARREEAFHLAHGRQLLDRLLDSGGAAREAIVEATQRLLAVAAGIFEPVAGETEALSSGVTSTPSAALAERWWSDVVALYGSHGVELGRPPAVDQRARQSRSEHFASLQREIRRVIDLDPAARW